MRGTGTYKYPADYSGGVYSPSVHGRLLNNSQNIVGQPCGQLAVPRLCQVHKVYLIGAGRQYLVGIQIVASHGCGYEFKFLPQTFRFFGAAFSHGKGNIGFYILPPYVLGGYYQNIRFLVPPAVGDLGFCNKALKAQGNAGRGSAKTFLGVIGAQHDNQEIHRLMGHKAWIKVIKAGQAFMDGIIETGGAAGQALFQDKKAIPKVSLEKTGPALLFTEPPAGFSAIAVGVGIAIA